MARYLAGNGPGATDATATAATTVTDDEKALCALTEKISNALIEHIDKMEERERHYVNQEKPRIYLDGKMRGTPVLIDLLFGEGVSDQIRIQAFQRLMQRYHEAHGTEE